MTKIKDDSVDELKAKSLKYNSITASILENKKFHKKEKLLQVAQSIDRLIEIAKKKVAE